MEIQDLTLWQGDTWSIDVTVYGANGVVLDLTGYTLRAQLRKKYTDALPSATFTATASDPTTGIINLILSATDTAALTKGTYVYDVEIEKNSVVYKPVGGRIVVMPEATK